MTKRTTVRSIQAALAAHGASPRKSFSQNFLIDQGVLKDIVDASELNLADTVLEVGPGLGVLTEALRTRVKQVIAVEKDRAFTALLKERFSDANNVSVVHGDILRIPHAALGIGTVPYKVIANLPYSITSNFLRTFLGAPYPPSLCVVMVQKEVADRIVAVPPNMNLLALSVCLSYVPKIVRAVPAQSFWPKPKVSSAILKLSPHRAPDLQTDQEVFFLVARTAFQGKRKQLANSLAPLMPSKSSLLKVLYSSGIQPNARPQEVSLKKWINLVRILKHSIV